LTTLKQRRITWSAPNSQKSSRLLAPAMVGAALTQRPGLHQAVVCLYPVEDMLRFQKFMDGPYWVPEYGSSDDPKQFPYPYAYSPYHHVKAGVKYPAVLFITNDEDTRVAPLRRARRQRHPLADRSCCCTTRNLAIRAGDPQIGDRGTIKVAARMRKASLLICDGCRVALGHGRAETPRIATSRVRRLARSTSSCHRPDTRACR